MFNGQTPSSGKRKVWQPVSSFPRGRVAGAPFRAAWVFRHNSPCMGCSLLVFPGPPAHASAASPPTILRAEPPAPSPQSLTLPAKGHTLVKCVLGLLLHMYKAGGSGQREMMRADPSGKWWSQCVASEFEDFQPQLLFQSLQLSYDNLNSTKLLHVQKRVMI